MDAPRLVTALPGPKARALIDRDERYTSPSYTRIYPLAIERAQGAVIEDVDGNCFLDFNAGIAVCATGHCHDDVVRAIEEQSRRLIHMSGTDFYYASQGALAEKLAQLAPQDGPNRVFFSNSGAEALEAAIKLARFHTRRTHLVAFLGAFHGRTLGALSLTASKTVQRGGFAPLLPGVTHVSYPHCYRCPRRPDAEACCWQSLDELERLFRHVLPPDEVAAIFVEPIQGEGGYVVPPDGFLQRLREITRRHGMLLVVDEVQSGMGRTGKMFAIEHSGVEPDIICLAKGIASGLPLGAIIAPESIMQWPPGSHASTFGGNPVACAAALETIRLLETSLMQQADRTGALLVKRLQQLQQKYEPIGDVRGRGLMVGAELVVDRASREPARQLRDAIIQDCFQRGLLLLGCGQSTLRFCPPLVVTAEQVETAMSILDDVLVQRC